MSQTTTAQHEWVKSILGLDVSAIVDRQADRKGPANGGDNPDRDVRSAALTFQKRKEDETKGTRAPQPKDSGLWEAIKKTEKQIELMDDLGFDVARLREDLVDCTWAGDRAEKIADEQKRKDAIAKVKKRLEDIEKHVKALETAAKSIMGAKKGKPSADEKSQAYKKALEDYYGLTIENPGGMANTHFDRVFDMFGTVPVGDAKQDKLKILRYDSDPGSAGSGAYDRSDFSVEMGDFGTAQAEEGYEIDGKPLSANSFNVTTLHEIGHAVDFKNGIMTANMGKAGCGGWVNMTVDQIAAVFLVELKKTPGLSNAVTDPDLTTAIKTALQAGTTNKLGTIPQDDWDKIIDFLTDKCVAIRSANSQWWSQDPVRFDGKVYQQAYNRANAWWRYEFSARAATKVNDYQWRAPGEWFAEVYAISWLKKKKPPAGVDASMLPYMWQE